MADFSQYEGILHLPHHISAVHPPMSRQDRAAQFSPFAALTGYEDAIAETARLTITLGEGFGDPVAYEMEGQKEDGLFFFQLREKQTGDSDSSLSEYSVFMDLLFHGENLEQYPYVLEFFDGGGHPLVDSTGR